MQSGRGMPLYFLDLVECGALIEDEEGETHASLDDAKRAALKAVRDVMCNEVAGGQLSLACRLDVFDDERKLVYSLPFKDALTVTGL